MYINFNTENYRSNIRCLFSKYNPMLEITSLKISMRTVGRILIVPVRFG